MTQTNEGPRKVIRVTVERPGRKALVAEWGGISLKWQVNAVLDDQPAPVWNVGTDLLQRLLADTCELCGSHDQIEVHHVKALRDLQPNRNGPKPEWIKIMVARRRKTLVVCRTCHEAVQHGLPRKRMEAV
jgi:hypothetical protein